MPRFLKAELEFAAEYRLQTLQHLTERAFYF